MTDNERDPKVAAAYRGLAQPGPPARLDDAILAASRRSVHAGPRASRAGPRSAVLRRWSVPLSLAAVVVLSVMVTLRVKDEAPDVVSPTPATPPPAVKPAPMPKDDAVLARAEPAQPASVPPPPAEARAPARAADSQRNQAPAAATRKTEPALPEAMREAPRDESRLPKFSQDPGPIVAERRADTAPAAEAPAAAPSAAATGPAAAPPAPIRAAPASQAAAPAIASRPAAKPAPLGRMAEQGAGGAAAPAGEAQDQFRDRATKGASVELAKRAEDAETPERQLERIVVLRREGKHAEADKLLAEFKQRHPQYRIPEATLEKVLPPR